MIAHGVQNVAKFGAGLKAEPWAAIPGHAGAFGFGIHQVMLLIFRHRVRQGFVQDVCKYLIQAGPEADAVEEFVNLGPACEPPDLE